MGRSHAGADLCVDRRSLSSSRLLTLPALTHCWAGARCRPAAGSACWLAAPFTSQGKFPRGTSLQKTDSVIKPPP